MGYAPTCTLAGTQAPMCFVCRTHVFCMSTYMCFICPHTYSKTMDVSVHVTGISWGPRSYVKVQMMKQACLLKERYGPGVGEEHDPPTLCWNFDALTVKLRQK